MESKLDQLEEYLKISDEREIQEVSKLAMYFFHNPNGSVKESSGAKKLMARLLSDFWKSQKFDRQKCLLERVFLQDAIAKGELNAYLKKLKDGIKKNKKEVKAEAKGEAKVKTEAKAKAKTKPKAKPKPKKK